MIIGFQREKAERSLRQIIKWFQRFAHLSPPIQVKVDVVEECSVEIVSNTIQAWGLAAKFSWFTDSIIDWCDDIEWEAAEYAVTA